jgi:hypothetical protein
MNELKILFVGESWLGSSARTLKEALRKVRGLVVDEVNVDFYFTRPRSPFLRATNRLLNPLLGAEFERALLEKCAVFRPDALVVYKGSQVTQPLLQKLRRHISQLVNIFPDCSPHAHGTKLQQAIGDYDLVISTKPFHPRHWKSTYGYANRCVFVAHGYDSQLHLVTNPPKQFSFDVVMAATWRAEYGELMLGFASHLANEDISVGIAGSGWLKHANSLPKSWTIAGPLHGEAYVDWMRSGRICIAPVSRHIVVNGRKQPGDEDSTRSYELAAAHCFFIHKRTDFAMSLYDERTAVPMFDDARELADQIKTFLPLSEKRAAMAATAHHTAVPKYSIESRAEVIAHLIGERAHHKP